MEATIKIRSAILFALWLLVFPLAGNAQEFIENIEPDTTFVAISDTAFASISDSAVSVVLSEADSNLVVPEAYKTTFKPNPTKAVLLGLIPGMGQVYNRQYWKLPLVYGGFMGFIYAITWNNKNYQDYWGGYKAIMTDAINYRAALEAAESADVDYEFSKAWTELRHTTDPKVDVFNTSLQNDLKSKKDYFRRYRDLSIILAVGFYAITLIDAYVDAQLFDFDISPDLSMRVEPVVSPQTRYSSRNFGVNCSFTF